MSGAPAAGLVPITSPPRTTPEVCERTRPTCSPALIIARVAAACESSTTDGTLASPGPCETVRVIVEPWLMRAPASGLWSITSSVGSFENSYTTSGLKPSFWTNACACESCR